ncbi:MAG: septum formation initiator family protein [Candidatus Firestonebacteria bacterium]
MSKNNRFRKYNTTVIPAGRVRINNWPGKEKLIKILIYAVLAVVVYFFMAGNAGLIHLIRSKLEKSKIEREIALLEEENRKAAVEIQTLRSDLKSVERIAREELGLIKKGEVVYKFIIKKENENDRSGNRNSDKR